MNRVLLTGDEIIISSNLDRLFKCVEDSTKRGFPETNDYLRLDDIYKPAEKGDAFADPPCLEIASQTVIAITQNKVGEKETVVSAPI